MPLLMDLRASLRGELRLESLPPAYFTLRITPDGDAAENRARIWHETSQGTWQSVSSELDSHQLTPGRAIALPDEMAELAEAVSPSAAVAASAQIVETALRGLLAQATPEDMRTLNLAQLANRALEHKLIDAQLADSLNGFSVMRLLAAADQDRGRPRHCCAPDLV